jgi:hypothetical protein
VLSLPRLRREKNGKNRQSFRECKFSKYKKTFDLPLRDDRNPVALLDWPSVIYHSVWRSSGFCLGRISDALDIEAKELMIKVWVSQAAGD